LEPRYFGPAIAPLIFPLPLSVKQPVVGAKNLITVLTLGGFMKNLKSRGFRSLVLITLLFSMGVTGKGCGGEDIAEDGSTTIYDLTSSEFTNEGTADVSQVSFKFSNMDEVRGYHFTIEATEKESGETTSATFDLGELSTRPSLDLIFGIYDFRAGLASPDETLIAENYEIEVKNATTDILLSFKRGDSIKRAPEHSDVQIGIVIEENEDNNPDEFSNGEENSLYQEMIEDCLENGIPESAEPTLEECIDWVDSQIQDITRPFCSQMCNWSGQTSEGYVQCMSTCLSSLSEEIEETEE
jgi:hypothetical protein